MIISSADFVKVYAENSEDNLKKEQITSSDFSNGVAVTCAVEIKPLIGIEATSANHRDNFILWDFNTVSQDSEISFSNQQLKAYRRYALKKETRVKKKKHKLGKANFPSYTANKENLILDEVTIQMPSRLVTNFEGNKKQFERFCNIEITPD
ncbi:hypothetical protein [Flavobacterium sp.]|uniref:hypothetical protein n=1 Tax=Flavobacterium sp. TaxID=239 RepID=UPI003D6B57ED